MITTPNANWSSCSVLPYSYRNLFYNPSGWIVNSSQAKNPETSVSCASGSHKTAPRSKLAKYFHYPSDRISKLAKSYPFIPLAAGYLDGNNVCMNTSSRLAFLNYFVTVHDETLAHVIKIKLD